MFVKKEKKDESAVNTLNFFIKYLIMGLKRVIKKYLLPDYGSF